MRLNDRDYMRGRTGVPSPRGGYKFIRNIAIPFALACVVLATAYWVFDRSLAHPHTPTSSSQSSAAPIEPPSTTPQPAMQTATKPPPQNTHGIYKCMVGGKTIYSDQACQKNAKNKALELHDSAGIVSPPKENVDELAAQRVARERAYALAIEQRARSAPAMSKKTECDLLDRSIETYDAMARQPQTGQMQDWIRGKRTEARNRQFEIHC